VSRFDLEEEHGMEIRAGGRRWVVDARQVASGSEAARACWNLSFTHAESDGERVELRWIPRPEHLTETVARRLFELAGERLWRDPRSGMIYRIQLVDEGGPGDDADLAHGRMLARFRTGSGAGTVEYDLGRPLGLASDAELQALADRALEGIRGVSA
jgi:hypothetical protein